MSSEIVQFLKEDGTVTDSFKQELEDQEIKELYRFMVLTRLFDEKCLKLQRTGRIGFYIGCMGQEASQIGSAYALKKEDWIFPAYREPGILFMKKIPMRDIIAQLIGNEADLCKGRQMPCHYTFKNVNYLSVSSPLATQLPHAVGVAFAAKYRGDKIVTMAYFGDGASSEGDFHVALNFAAVYKTPTVFVCQNNQWAISVPVTKQTASESIAIKAKAYGMPGIKVDGNDVLAMYHVTKQAVEHARNGGGPTLIESYTYRLGSHSSSDDHTRYRDKDEHEKWVKKDPLIRLELYLKNKELLTDQENKDIYQSCEDELNEGIVEAEKFGQPKLNTIFEDVYKEVPYNLKLQMNALIDEQIRLGESVDNSMAFPL